MTVNNPSHYPMTTKKAQISAVIVSGAVFCGKTPSDETVGSQKTRVGNAYSQLTRPGVQL
jgi:6,7-dimethyl-8-ribityllumazine synthase